MVKILLWQNLINLVNDLVMIKFFKIENNYGEYYRPNCKGAKRVESLPTH